MRCRACNGIFVGDMLTYVPVEVAVASMNALRCPHCGAGPKKLSFGQSRTAAEDDKLRGVGPDASIQARVDDWLAGGEPGLSANAIRRFMTGATAGPFDCPRDMGDLHRCMLLLRRIPEWEARIGEMTVCSTQWAAIVAVWPQLSASYREEAGPNLASWPRPRTGEILRGALDMALAASDSHC
jgi:hypothetical protein